MYSYKGYGLHGVWWHGDFGHPRSHGCVNLPIDAAAALAFGLGGREIAAREVQNWLKSVKPDE